MFSTNVTDSYYMNTSSFLKETQRKQRHLARSAQSTNSHPPTFSQVGSLNKSSQNEQGAKREDWARHDSLGTPQLHPACWAVCEVGRTPLNGLHHGHSGLGKRWPACETSWATLRVGKELMNREQEDRHVAVHPKELTVSHQRHELTREKQRLPGEAEAEVQGSRAWVDGHRLADCYGKCRVADSYALQTLAPFGLYLYGAEW